MLQTLEAEIDANGNIRSLEPLPVNGPRRALVTPLTEPPSDDSKVNSAPANGATGEAAQENRRREQMSWMKSNAEQYGGQYIALAGRELISTGKTFREANEAAHAAGRRDAFVTYLPKPDEVLEMGGWR